MAVSFVIPLFNQLSFTQDCVATLQSTLPPNLPHEIILVDNASTDGTREWLKTLRAPIRTLLNDRNLGYGGACNRGAAAAVSDHIAILNNDLIFLPGWLEPMLDAIAQHPRGVIGNIQLSVRTRTVDHAGVFFDNTGKPHHTRPPLASLAGRASYSVPAVTGACMLMRAETFQQLNGFNEHYVNGYEDMDFCLRARAAGSDSIVAPQSIIFHYVGTSDGRYARESANATRFADTWSTTARTLTAADLPIEPGPPASPPWSTYDSRAHATLQLFHPSDSGYSESASSVRLYRTGRWTRMRATIPRLTRGDVWLRLDPADFPATLRVAGVRLLPRIGERAVFVARGAEQLAKLLTPGGTLSAHRDNERWLTFECDGNDPQLYFRPTALSAELAAARDLVLELCLHTTIPDPAT